MMTLFADTLMIATRMEPHQATGLAVSVKRSEATWFERLRRRGAPAEPCAETAPSAT